MSDPAKSGWPAIRKRIPRLAFSLVSRLDGTWAEIEAFMRDHQLGLFETLERVRRDRLSLARFGDGEFLLALSPRSNIVYQRGSPDLQAELRDILRGGTSGSVPLLVAIPGIGTPYFRHYWAKYWPIVSPMLNPAATYGHASVSRESMFRPDAEKARLAWRQVWDGKDVCFVVGKGSRFEPIGALFDNTASQRTILSLPREAYADIPRLIDEIVATLPRDTLILLSLGPAATVLAARLASLGYWALDIGHIANSYRTIALGAPRPEQTPLARRG